MKHVILSLAVLVISGCSLAPDLVMPDVQTPAAFKEVQGVSKDEKIADGAWQRAQEQPSPTTAWWQVFKDAQLDALIEEARKNSPTLEIASQRLTQARAQAGVTDAALLPRVDIGAGPTIQRPSNISRGLPSGVTPQTETRYQAQGSISYEADLFSRNRAASNAAEYNVLGAEAQHRAATLALEADVAQAYVALRALDREQDFLKTTQRLREDTLNLTRRSLKIGDVSALDVARAESELAAAKAETHAVSRQRAEAEHLLALLLGKPPSALNFKKHPLAGAPPSLPAGLPSTMLERRPDIAAAQHRMAAANESIGVARAAFFPVLNITATGGFQSGQLGQLFEWSSRTWLLGPLVGTMLTMPVFDAGRNFANLALSKASFQEAVANYRQQVLVAFREVEDQLSGLRHLKGQGEAQAEAVRAARKAFSIAEIRYKNGYISYLDFIDAQRSLLAAERGEVQVLGNRYITTIQLVRALGGGWAGQVKMIYTPFP